MAERTFTAREKQQAAARELGFRRHVYATRVSEGRMKQADADFQIGVMAAMEADYRALAEADEAKERLL